LQKTSAAKWQSKSYRLIPLLTRLSFHRTVPLTSKGKLSLGIFSHGAGLTRDSKPYNLSSHSKFQIFSDSMFEVTNLGLKVFNIFAHGSKLAANVPLRKLL
jgi:hypothetical protein